MYWFLKEGNENKYYLRLRDIIINIFWSIEKFDYNIGIDRKKI